MNLKLLVYHQIDLPLINLGFELRTTGKERKEIREIIHRTGHKTPRLLNETRT